MLRECIPFARDASDLENPLADPSNSGISKLTQRQGTKITTLLPPLQLSIPSMFPFPLSLLFTCLENW